MEPIRWARPVSRFHPSRYMQAVRTRFGAATRWQESTFEALRWERVRRASRRWAVAGAAVGALLGVLLFAPAAWLCNWVSHASAERVMLVEARGSLWTGDAQVVLTAGPGSREARALPGRLFWTLRVHGLGLRLNLTQACCVTGSAALLFQPSWGRWRVSLVPQDPTLGEVGHWPAAVLSGLGTPWNTMDLGGELRLSARDAVLESVQHRWRFLGNAQLDVVQLASKVSTLDHLGTYRLTLDGNADAGMANISLTTIEGALTLNGSGSWSDVNGLHFTGQAQAQPAQQSALDNLLNIIGHREGERSILSIG